MKMKMDSLQRFLSLLGFSSRTEMKFTRVGPNRFKVKSVTFDGNGVSRETYEIVTAYDAIEQS